MAISLGSMMTLGAALVTGAALLTGCGSDDPDPVSSGSTTTTDTGTTTSTNTGTNTGTQGASTYVLVHGAWGAAWHWDRTREMLEAEGHEVVAMDLPAHGDDMTPVADASLQAYTDSVVAELDAAAEPVILVGHSMAGMVISQAAEARPEKVRTLVYLAAYLVQDGQSLLDIVEADAGAQLGPYLVFSQDGSEAALMPEAMGAVFCDDCSAADLAELEAQLRPEPVAPLGTPITVSEAGWGSVPRVYIETSNDKVLSPAMQEQLYTAIPCDQVLS
ncbi:MAG TPA: alpha/beta fold hydrolase, partial [Candidatus Nanopelagicales bacterium]|nr:alpha/beta fold hydrolase [Candidatus Nanopelagicales bacterium]